MSDNFKEIMRYASGCFPGLREWIENNPDNMLTKQIWKNALDGTDVEAAKEALREIVAGRIEMNGYTKLPAIVAKRAREIAYASRGLPQTQSEVTPGRQDDRFKCLTCKDSGWVSVVAPRATISDNGPVLWPMLCCCPDCKQGEKNHKPWGKTTTRSRVGPPLFYDGKRMCKIEPTYTNAQMIEAYKEWHSTYEPPVDESHDEEFYDQQAQQEMFE